MFVVEDPMDPARKRRLLEAVGAMGFKEIGFPSASQPDLDFLRQLIEDDLIPDDVTIQVLTQCRPELIKRTYEGLRGVPRAMAHFYNSTSVLQRRVVFRSDRVGITRIAVDVARLCRKLEGTLPGTEVRYEYSARELHRHGTRLRRRHLHRGGGPHRARADRRTIILNLPATVEMYTASVEFFPDPPITPDNVFCPAVSRGM